MKSRTLVCIATVAALGFGTVAQAQPHQQWRGEARGPHQQQQWRGVHQAQPQQQYQQHYQQRYQQQWQHTAPAYQHRYVQPQYSQRVYDNYAPRYYGAPHYRSYSYGPRYYVGGYAPHYAGRSYWINDWRARHLYAPPYGYQWVQTDTGDVLLLALATGLIANAILAQ